MAFKSASIEGLIILRGFDFGQITKRPSEDLREFSRSESARLQAIIKCGLGDEIHSTNGLLCQLEGNGTANEGGRQRKKAIVNAVQNR